MSTYSSFTSQIISLYQEILCNPQVHTDNGLLSVHKFFKNFYDDLCNDPQSIGIPHFDEVLLDNHIHHSKEKNFAKAKNKTAKLVFDILKMIYDSAIEGQVHNDILLAPRYIYDKAIKSQKTIKNNVLNHMETIGLSVSVAEEIVLIQSKDKTISIESLVLFAKACFEYDKKGHFYFYICDFNIFDKNYVFDIVLAYKKLLDEEQYKQFLIIHEYMILKKYEVLIKFDSFFIIGINYIKKSIKSSPLLSQTYNILYKNPFIIAMRFVAMSRITPITNQASMETQMDLYNSTRECNNCGWCKNQKGLLRPSLMTLGKKQKTVCWYKQKSYYNINEKETLIILEYIQLHEYLNVS